MKFFGDFRHFITDEAMKTLNEAQLKSYFLGELPAPEAELLEEQCAMSAELTEQAQIVERELIDDYLRGFMPEPQARSFEKNYLITEKRLEILRLAEGLWEAVKPQPAAPKK